jgi:protein-tyrosine phosphatase
MIEDVDPTALDNFSSNPLLQRFEGVATHGMHYFDVPYISEIAPGLWQGGCRDGLVLPPEITDVVSLYRWEKYDRSPGVALHSFVEITMYDTQEGTPDRDEVFALADWVNLRRKAGGQVLVHCQAGLNRSSLVAATALVRDGSTPVDAVKMIRSKRSEVCLCNRAFENFVIDLA